MRPPRPRWLAVLVPLLLTSSVTVLVVGLNRDGEYLDIRSVPPDPPPISATANASTGEFTHSCGRNENTECVTGDRSTYSYPVLHAARDRNLAPAAVQIRFSGSPVSKVVAMPSLLHVHADSRWSCTGFTDRHTAHYPLCPPGSKLIREFVFPNCWDGKELDSAHIVDTADNGACPHGTFPIPRLRLELTYDRPPGRDFTVDAVPDHAEFTAALPDELMDRIVVCLNSGLHCS